MPLPFPRIQNNGSIINSFASMAIIYAILSLILSCVPFFFPVWSDGKIPYGYLFVYDLFFALLLCISGTILLKNRTFFVRFLLLVYSLAKIGENVALYIFEPFYADFIVLILAILFPLLVLFWGVFGLKPKR